jgi:hypothetical protein
LPYWLAVMYAESGTYLATYKKFIDAHKDGLLRLNTLKSSNKGSCSRQLSFLCPTLLFQVCFRRRMHR